LVTKFGLSCVPLSLLHFFLYIEIEISQLSPIIHHRWAFICCLHFSMSGGRDGFRTYQGLHCSMQGMSVVPSELGICALQRGISVGLGFFDPIKRRKPPNQFQWFGQRKTLAVLSFWCICRWHSKRGSSLSLLVHRSRKNLQNGRRKWEV
jgi:hypothetical protein